MSVFIVAKIGFNKRIIKIGSCNFYEQFSNSKTNAICIGGKGLL